MQKNVRSIPREPYARLDDMWYVGRAKAEGEHSEVWAWHVMIPRDHWGQKCKTMLYDYQTWSEESLMQA